MTDAPNAVAILLVSLADGTRVAPAALGLQHGAIQIKESLGMATSTLTLLKEFKNVLPIPTTNDKFDVEYPSKNSKF